MKPQFYSGTALQHEMITFWQGPGGSGLTTAQLTYLQTQFDNNWATVFTKWGATSSDYRSCYIQDYSLSSGLSINPNAAVNNAGAMGAQQPDNVAGLVSWKTSERYKGGHGRWYLPTLGASAVTAPNQFSAGAASNLSTAITAFLTAMGAIAGTYGGPYSFVIYRNRRGLHGTPHTLIPTSFVVQPILATQRRRLRKAPHH